MLRFLVSGLIAAAVSAVMIFIAVIGLLALAGSALSYILPAVILVALGAVGLWAAVGVLTDTTTIIRTIYRKGL